MPWTEEEKRKKREYNRKYYAEVETEEIRQRRLAKSRERGKKHYLANKERYAERRKKYYVENREAVLVKNKKWDADNPEKRRARQVRFLKANPEKALEYQRRYQSKPTFKLRSKAAHARQRAEGGIYLKDIQKLYADNVKQYGVLTCYICEKAVKEGEDSIDHKIPVTKGGTNNLDNIGVAHILCNNKKHNTILPNSLD